MPIRSSPGCAASWRQFPGVNLYLQPVQDLRVGGRGANAQYHVHAPERHVQDLLVWAPRMLQKLRTLPGLLDVNSDQQDKGLQCRLVIDRATASRLGLSAQASTIRSTTLLASARSRPCTPRSINTTWCSKWSRSIGKIPTRTQEYLCRRAGRRSGALERANPLPTFHGAVGRHPSRASFHRWHALLQPCAGTGIVRTRPARSHRSRRHRHRFALDDPRQLQGTAQAFHQSALANEPLLIAAASIAVYIVLGMLYESLMHPLTILSTLPSAGVGALLALLVCGIELSRDRAHRHHPADRHRQEERHHDDRLRPRGRAQRGKIAADAIFEACLLRFRPIMMTTHGRPVRRFAARDRRGMVPSCAARWASRLSAACCCRGG